MNKLRKKWAHKYNSCIRCDRNTKEHHAKGLCRSCYQLTRMKRIPRYRGNGIVRLKINPLCSICMKNFDLVVHHRDRNKLNNDLDNLVTLCRSCHTSLHNYSRLKAKFKNYDHLIA